MARLKTEGRLLGSCLAARHLGIHRSTLASWRRRGEIRPAVVEEGPPRRFKYTVEDLEKFRERINYDE